MENFRLFSAKFNEEKSFGRKNFLNMNYVLFYLLKQLRHDVDENNFSLMKTEERKKNHDEIIGKKLFGNDEKKLEVKRLISLFVDSQRKC